MRFDIYLDVNSSEKAIAFYVDELELFEVVTDYGMNGFLLRAIDNPGLALLLSEQQGIRNEAQPFGICVKNCREIYDRLKRNGLRSGAQILAGPDGVVGLFDWPCGRNLFLADPSGNRIVVLEDHIAG